MKPENWLKARGTRRVRAVEYAIGQLGLNYGRGHVDNLYTAAYEDGFQDALALAVRKMRAEFDCDLPAHLDMEYVILHNKAAAVRNAADGSE